MIVSIAGVLGGADLSGVLERDGGFEIESAVGKRMDTTRFGLFDPTLAIAVPDRAEVWIYDTPPSPGLIDGDFETQAIDAAWLSSSVGTGGANASDTNPHNGSRNLLLTNPSTGNYGGVYNKYGVRVTAGQSLSIWTWIKASAAGSSGPLRVTFANPGSFVSDAGIASGQPSGQAATVSFDFNPAFTTSWTFTSNTIVVPAGYAWAFVEIYANGNGTLGTLYFDDLSFVTTVVDPPNAISAYNTYLRGAGNEVTSTTPANWTPRMFAGFSATPAYSMVGAQRKITVTAQDYTFRLRSTVANMAFVGGLTDAAIITALFSQYRPDVDLSQVQVTVSSMPAISFPVHTLEQFLERIIKISRANYRLDYYKRLFYGPPGFLVAPFGLSDTPNGTTTFGMEKLSYAPDTASLANKAWVVGAKYLSKVQTWQVPPSLVTGSNYQFNLPGDPEQVGMSVTVGGVDQGVIGVVPAAGDFADQSSFKNNVIIQHNPPLMALKVTPASATAVIVTGKFRYPLITVVSDATLIAATGGKSFETPIRDRRITDLALAQQTGNAFLKNQGAALKGGTVTTRKRSLGGVLLQPGQFLPITHSKLFAGGVLKDAGGNPITSTNFLITKLRYLLDRDSVEPYAVEVSFADRQVGDASNDLVDALLNEQARINAATADEDINSLIADFQGITGEKLGLTETIVAKLLGWRHFAMRARLTVRGFRDVALRYQLMARTYRDLALRARVVVQNYRDLALRFRMNVRNYRDFALRSLVVGGRVAFTQQTGSGTGTAVALVLTPAQTLAVGDLVVIFLASTADMTDNATPTASVTDAKGNTWTAQTIIKPNSQGAAGVVFWSVITTALLTSDTVTANLTLSVSTTWNATAVSRQFFGWPSTWTLDRKSLATVTVGSSGLTTWSITTGGALASGHELIIVVYLEGGASGTPTIDAPAQGVIPTAPPIMALIWRMVGGVGGWTTSGNTAGGTTGVHGRAFMTFQ
jgi:hypothetical protein